MVSKSSRVNLRISDEMLELIDEIRERKGHGTTSDVIREALERYAEEEASGWNTDLIKVKVPKRMLEDLEQLVMAGDAEDVAQAINFALHEWIGSRIDHHLQGRDALRKRVGEILQERATKDRMRTAAKDMGQR